MLHILQRNNVNIIEFIASEKLSPNHQQFDVQTSSAEPGGNGGRFRAALFQREAVQHRNFADPQRRFHVAEILRIETSRTHCERGELLLRILVISICNFSSLFPTFCPPQEENMEEDSGSEDEVRSSLHSCTVAFY